MNTMMADTMTARRKTRSKERIETATREIIRTTAIETVMINPPTAPRPSFLNSVGARCNQRGEHAASTLFCEVYAMIDIENLRLSIEGKEVLKGIDLQLRPGARGLFRVLILQMRS